VKTYFDSVLAAVRAVPGVESAGLTSQLPLSGDTDQYGVHTEPIPGMTPVDIEHPGFRYAVSDGYLETMGIPIRRGRSLLPSDRAGALPVAVVDETTARRGWVGRGAIGQRVRIGPNDSGPWFTIVGIAFDVKQTSLDMESDNAIYVPESQQRFADDAMSLVVRTRVSPARMTAALKRAIWSVDRNVPVVRIATMTQLLALSTGARRYALLLIELFAAVAVILAGAGIYALLAGSVAERTREIGVRAALGATRAAIVRLVLREGMTMTAVGVGAGLVVAAAASRIIGSLLFATSRLDPAVYVGVAALLAGVAALACWVPAERAARVDPAETLRAE
jgi:putative ABC transport system permease protein